MSSSLVAAIRGIGFIRHFSRNQFVVVTKGATHPVTARFLLDAMF